MSPFVSLSFSSSVRFFIRTAFSNIFSFRPMDKASCFIFLSMLFFRFYCFADILTDQSALLSFKNQMKLDQHHIIGTNWSTGTSVCNWMGVVCGSKHQRVTGLDLSNMLLDATIPPNLGNLSFLVFLRLNNNSFHGQLPTELTNLFRLEEINLSENSFDGEFPYWLCNFPRLRYMFIRNNGFTGTIPQSIGNLSHLQFLDLRFNHLQGSIPSEIGTLQNLTWLDLEHNNFTGSIPSTIFNLSNLVNAAFTNNSLSGSLPLDICSNSRSLQGLYLSRNLLSGSIPTNIYECSSLQILILSYNNFKGPIPREIGNLTSLRQFDTEYNNLDGIIPEVIGNLNKLEVLDLSFSNLQGTIPPAIFNISTLRTFGVTGNSLSGKLPLNLGQYLPSLRDIYLSGNQLSGSLPDSISNASSLVLIDINSNKFMGNIPMSFGNLANLQILNLENNIFSGESSNGELSFLVSLTNCRQLRVLLVDQNPLNGDLPVSIGNFSDSFDVFDASSCGIFGEIPNEIGNLSSLSTLALGDNGFTGFIPTALGRLQNLQMLGLTINMLNGSVPNGICNLAENMYDLRLDANQISGPIPECFGNFSSLRYLYLASNRFASFVPLSLWKLKDILELDLSSNVLSGQLSSELGNLKVVVILKLSHNQFVGNIPSTIGGLQGLEKFSLAHNLLEGSIPETFQSLLSLRFLDLSENNLSGRIPMSLEKLTDLVYFNVSFNNLVGEIPSGGPFQNFTSQSFLSNEALCGNPRFNVLPCRPSSKHDRSKRKTKLVLVIGLPIVSSLMLVSIFVFLFTKFRKNKKRSDQSLTKLDPIPAHGRISYHELHEATEGFNESNLLGNGSFGAVYKGVFPNGIILAIKVFKLPLEKAIKSFETECDVIRNIRHRNLIKVISSCSNLEFRALVLEYIPKGSLEMWLYSHNLFLNIKQRLDIMTDVACALEYLHQGNSTTPIVHCDLKPSNVLLDDDMVGHVSDFGIAKLLTDEELAAHTETLGTIGYIAPEYGLGGLISTSCDVYSYGIMLMEVFTRKRPTDEMFNEEVSLMSWVSDALPDSVARVVDVNLMGDNLVDESRKLQCMGSIMELAKQCCAESPEQRMNMNDVLVTLQKIRLNFALDNFQGYEKKVGK